VTKYATRRLRSLNNAYIYKRKGTRIDGRLSLGAGNRRKNVKKRKIHILEHWPKASIKSPRMLFNGFSWYEACMTCFQLTFEGSYYTKDCKSNQNKLEFLTWPNNSSHYKVHKSEVDMWIVTAKCLGMTGGTSMSLVCGRNRSGRRMTEYQEAGCSRGWMQQLEMNAGRR